MESLHRVAGAMVSDCQVVATAFALDNLQKRGELSIDPGETVHEGMIIREGESGHMSPFRSPMPRHRPTDSAAGGRCSEWPLTDVDPGRAMIHERVLVRMERIRGGKETVR